MLPFGSWDRVRAFGVIQHTAVVIDVDGCGWGILGKPRSKYWGPVPAEILAKGRAMSPESFLKTFASELAEVDSPPVTG